MKNLLSLFCMLFFMACNNPKQNSDSRNANSVDTTVKVDSIGLTRTDAIEIPKNVDEIKSVYTATNNQLAKGELDSVSYKYNCYNEKSGTITYFTAKGKLRLIKHSYAEYDHHNATDQFFVIDEVPYFVFYNRVNWSFESGAAAEGATKDDITEQRFYLVDNKPVQCLEKKFSVSSKDKKPNVNNAENKVVECSSSKPLIDALKKLIAFKNQPKKDCFGR
ncbi:hypothetical protein [Pedobacter namyangjuensis]|uniref:hypothetical protein n=1 Tax=Pedobacter namyangjuensis TaxID=600626 RepID=UPI0013B401E9|nr:hypothetical protein [Pedobacter namyangjuensis]